MIETSGKINYSKSKTLHCDDNSLSLKSEKTIDIDAVEYDILLSEKINVKNNENLLNKYATIKDNQYTSNFIYNDKISNNIEFFSSNNNTQTFIRNNYECNLKKNNKKKNVLKKTDILENENNKSYNNCQNISSNDDGNNDHFKNENYIDSYNGKQMEYVNDKEVLYEKGLGFRTMYSNQDICNEIENLSDHVTEFNSMKDISKIFLNYNLADDKSCQNSCLSNAETSIYLKETVVQDNHSPSEDTNRKLSENALKSENKNETFNNFDFSSIEKDIYISNEYFLSDYLKDNIPVNNNKVNENNYYKNKNFFKIGSNFSNETHSTKIDNKVTTKTQLYEYTKNEKEGSIKNLRGKKKNNNFYDIISKKGNIENYSVISLNNEKSVNMNVKYLEEHYFHNKNSMDIVKNIKHDCSSNPHNEVVINMNHNILSELNSNHSVYSLGESKKQKGGDKKEVKGEKEREKGKNIKSNAKAKTKAYVTDTQNKKIETCKKTQINNKDNLSGRATLYNESDVIFSQCKLYASPVKKNDVKDQKNQMLLASKQKIKKIWNKFKNNSFKEQNYINYENKKYAIPNIELVNEQKLEFDKYKNYSKNYISNKLNYTNNMEALIKSKCIFNWELAKKSLVKMLHSAHNYYFNGIKYSNWKLTCILTLGFSKSSNRVQQMFKATIPSKDGDSRKDVHLFMKKIPIYIWVKQFNLMNQYDGEYVTDGENFVMEASSLAFLNDYHQGITPKLYKILYEPESKHYSEYITPSSIYDDLDLFNDVLTERLKCNINGYVVIVSEFFSEDILDYIDRRQKKYNMKINNNEKNYMLYQCLNLLIRLHDAGLSHLDLTPENILISDNYEMRLCDLSKSTPIYTCNLRHIKNANNLYSFESCEPTIAKGPYMPPECWKIYWKYDTMQVKSPLKDLESITDQEKRKQFYFDVVNADKFMLGVFFFWIWANGNLWKCSDPLQDEDFFYFVKCDMDYDKFELTKKWPDELKHVIKQLLHMDYRKKYNLKDLLVHPWWSCKL